MGIVLAVATMFVIIMFVVLNLCCNFQVARRVRADDGASLRASKGLDPSILESFPVFTYSEVEVPRAQQGPLEIDLLPGTSELDQAGPGRADEPRGEVNEGEADANVVVEVRGDIEEGHIGKHRRCKSTGEVAESERVEECWMRFTLMLPEKEMKKYDEMTFCSLGKLLWKILWSSKMFLIADTNASIGMDHLCRQSNAGTGEGDHDPLIHKMEIQNLTWIKPYLEPQELLFTMTIPLELQSSAGSRAFLSVLKDVIRMNKPSVIALVETHVRGDQATSISNSIGYRGHLTVDARGFSGGIWIYWKQELVTVGLVNQNSQQITMEIS
ncbi:RING-H2 finger protein ATL32 [Bienertia sinuspersici]